MSVVDGVVDAVVGAITAPYLTTFNNRQCFS